MLGRFRAYTSFLSGVAVVYWVFIMPTTIFVPIFYGVYYWGTIGAYSLLAIWIAANFGTAILLNKARKHQRDNAYDDRLTDAKMREAMTYYLKIHSEGVKNQE